MDIEGRKSVVGPGDGYYVEPDQMHGCTCLEEGILLDVFSPLVSGKFEVDIEGRKSVVGPGDGYYVEPDQMHGCICLEEGILLDVFSPQRADFLK